MAATRSVPPLLPKSARNPSFCRTAVQDRTSSTTEPAESTEPGPTAATALHVPGREARGGEGTESYPFWRRNMVSLFVANMMLTCGFASASPYLPLILRELGFQGRLETSVGYTVGGFFVLSFFLTPVWGTVADHYGRKSMVIRAGLGMGLVYTLLPFSTSPWMFMALYVSMGAFNGFVPSSLALAATTTPVRKMGKALSLIQTGALLGNTLGPALGGLLAVTLSRYLDLYYVTGSFILGAGLVALLFARERKAPPRGAFRLTIVRDLRHLVRIPALPTLFGLNFLFSFSFFGSMPVASVFMLNMLQGGAAAGGNSEEFWMGAVAIAIAVASALGLPIWGRVLDRFEIHRVLALAMFAGALGSIPTWLAHTPLQLTLARLTFGLLAGGIMPSLVTVMKRFAPQGMEARCMALGTSFGMLGMGAGPLLSGWIGPAFGLRTYFAINSVLLLLGCLAWLRSGLRETAAAPATD